MKLCAFLYKRFARALREGVRKESTPPAQTPPKRGLVRYTLCGLGRMLDSAGVAGAAILFVAKPLLSIALLPCSWLVYTALVILFVAGLTVVSFCDSVASFYNTVASFYDSWLKLTGLQQAQCWLLMVLCFWAFISLCDLRYHVSELLKDKNRSWQMESSLRSLKMDAEILQRSMQRLQERIDEVETEKEDREAVNNLEVRIDRLGEDAVRLTARNRRSRSPARRSH